MIGHSKLRQYLNNGCCDFDQHSAGQTPATHGILDERYDTRIQNVHIEETIRYEKSGSSKTIKLYDTRSETICL